MKKLLGIAFILLAAVSVQAQKSIGVRAGYQNTHMVVDGSKIGSSGNSFFVNVYKDSRILPFLHFHSGIQYSQAESTINGNDYQINYLGAPLGLKAKVGPIYAIGGATVNFKLSENNEPWDESAKRYDTNLFLGAGLNILFLNVNARYAWGLTDVNRGIHNNAFQLGLGIRF